MGNINVISKLPGGTWIHPISPYRDNARELRYNMVKTYTPNHIKKLHGVSEISAGNEFSLVVTKVPALYSTIKILIDNEWVKEFRGLEIRGLEIGDQTAIFEFIDINDDVHVIEVQYDPDTNQIFPL